MSKKILLFSTLFCLQMLFSQQQDITGKWYVSNNYQEFIIKKDKNGYSAFQNTIMKDWSNYLNEPLKSITVKKDSLFFVEIHSRYLFKYKFKWDDNAKEYKGYSYRKLKDGSIPYRKRDSITLSRVPNVRDTTFTKPVEKVYTRQDSLRGSITPQRAWWNLMHYTLDFELDPEKKYIKGSNTITYKVLDSKKEMQIDLQSPMKITKVEQDGDLLKFTQDGNAYFVTLIKDQIKGASEKITVFYEGGPKISRIPPWDGGITYTKDSKGNPFIYTAVQGDGASLWWPNKDHMYDEPDNGMIIRVTVPKDLVAVSNGKLTSTKKRRGKKMYEWTVVNPINNYGVSLNVGKYVHFSDIYKGEKGDLICDYYVLEENFEKSKTEYVKKQAHSTLEAFEHWFGPYPFYEDGYKLVEGTGMEHQSAVGFSDYKNGYEDFDYSGSGGGLNLIVHESGHEWFANNITYKDMADMWVHEGFTTYSEALYLEYHFGKKAAEEYIKGFLKMITNQKNIIGDYHVNDTEYSQDVYQKGLSILHTLRQVINDDEKWRSILRGLNKDFYHQTVTSAEVEEYISKKSGLHLKPFFDQYLRSTNIPTLDYYFKDNMIAYRWINTTPEFNMPLKIKVNDKEKWVYPKTNRNWTYEYVGFHVKKMMIDSNFYVAAFKNMKGDNK